MSQEYYCVIDNVSLSLRLDKETNHFKYFNISKDKLFANFTDALRYFSKLDFKENKSIIKFCYIDERFGIIQVIKKIEKEKYLILL